MAIPYIDTNPKGNGYYTFKRAQDRDRALPLRLPGAVVPDDRHRHLPARPQLELLRPLRVLGPDKVEPLVNVDLSEFFWIRLLGVGLPVELAAARELPGILLVVLYLFVLPVLLLKLKWTQEWFGRFYEKMGAARYYIGITLFLIMMVLPIKMYLPLGVQPEVLRPHPGVLLQHLERGSRVSHWHTARPRRPTGTTTSAG